MRKQAIIFLIIFIFLVFMALHAGNGSKKRGKNQDYINAGKTLAERFNRMGGVFVDALKKEVEYIIDNNRWEALGLRDRKIYLFISFKKVKKNREVTLGNILTPGDSALNSLKIDVYDMLANAIKAAINHDRKLKQHIITLSVDPEVLKAAIAQTGDPMYKRSSRLRFSQMDSMNANYHFYFKALPGKKRIILGGRADIIEVNHEIASTYQYELDAKELFDSIPSPKPGISSTIHDPGYFKPAKVERVEKLKNPVIWYRPDENSDWEHINPYDRVKSKGQISFEVELPEVGGYLLLFLEDSRGALINLFPGTGSALRNRWYKIPDDLDYPNTEVLRDTASGTIEVFGRLDSGKIQTAVYTFDEHRGDETFYFFYSDKPNPKLEELLSRARETGKNIKRGKTRSVENYTQSFSGRKIREDVFFHSTLKLSLIHE